MFTYENQDCHSLFTGFLVLFLTSCSEIIDTNAKELKANVWVENDDDNLNCKLQFIDDKGKFTLQDKKDNQSYIITGVTVVNENDFTINHRETLSKYIFKYKINNDSVKITYESKSITLKNYIKINEKIPIIPILIRKIVFLRVA